MSDFLLFLLVASAGAMVTGFLLFLLLARRVPSSGERLRIAVPASLLAIAFACLIPFTVATYRGGTVLPAWTAWLLPFAALIILPVFWRSVLNRLPHDTGLLAETDGEIPEDAVNAWMLSDKVAPGRIRQQDEAAAKHHATGHDGMTTESENLLADIALRRMKLPESVQEEQHESNQAEPPISVQEEQHESNQAEPPISVQEEQYESNQAEPPISVQEEQHESEQEEPQISVQEKQPENGVGEHLEPIPVEAPRLVPYQPPTGANLAELLSFALDARQEGRLQDAVSWFLASLAADPGPDVHDGVLLDLCALLLEAGFSGCAMALLSSKFAEGTGTGLLHALRNELERHAFVQASLFPDA